MTHFVVPWKMSYNVDVIRASLAAHSPLSRSLGSYSNSSSSTLLFLFIDKKKSFLRQRSHEILVQTYQRTFYHTRSSNPKQAIVENQTKLNKATISQSLLSMVLYYLICPDVAQRLDVLQPRPLPSYERVPHPIPPVTMSPQSKCSSLCRR